MAENLNQENDEITVTLTLEDDSELECVVLTTLEAAGRQYRCGVGTFPSRGGAQVQVPHGVVYVLFEYLLQKHGRGLLYVVGPGMEQGVEGICQPFGQIISRATPRHTIRQTPGSFGRVQPKAVDGWLFEGGLECIVFVSQQGPGSADKIFR